MTIDPSGTAGPVALVTGTSSGIGLEAAVALAGAGFNVVATMRDLERSTALRERAEAAGVELDLRQLDVVDGPAAEATVDEVFADHRRIDILVNNAGAGYVGTLEQLSLEEIEAVLETNFVSVARMTKLVLPLLRARRSGRILTVTSVGGAVGQPFNDAYCAAKFAVEGLLESLAPVAAAHGVHVSVIEPGPVATSFIDNLGPSLASRPTGDDDPFADQWSRYLETVTATFAGAQTAEEVARVIVAAAIEARPRFRYQTSPVAEAFVGTKLADLSGQAVQATTSAWVT